MHKREQEQNRGRKRFLTPFPLLALAAATAFGSDRHAFDPFTLEPFTQAAFTQAAFVPDDPYVWRNTPVAGWPGQWHLVNQFVAGRDARVQGAWNAGWTGSGVVIGIVDDALQHAHPDLAPNYSAALSYDFGQDDADPSPVNANEVHGTSVAGVAAARGGNGIGVTGAAPLATLAGLRVDFANQTDAMFVAATLHQSSGTSQAIAIKNHSYGISVGYVRTAGTDLQAAAVSTSAAAGTIHVFAAGNDRGRETQGLDSDANKKQNQANPDVITVAALSSSGSFASYSNYGANVFVTAPSSSAGGFGITTTDLTGTAGYNSAAGDTFPDRDYTSAFGGTSSAAPLVSGVLALAKEAQPNLDVRFAKHLLVRTSDVVDPDDRSIAGGGDGSTAGSAWKTNAAGRGFNMNYGFGLVDAAGLVTEAQAFAGVTPLERFTTGPLAVNAAILDNAALSRTFTVTLADPRPLEEVVVTLGVNHAWLGDLTATLTSPAGTVSRLMRSNYWGWSPLNGTTTEWNLTTNAFWGESAGGTWTLSLGDTFTSDQGLWNSWGLTLRMGELYSGTAPAVATLGWAGGSGTWNSAGDGRWGGGEWIDGRTAVFSGSAGTVTVGAAGVTASQGLRFDIGGYVLAGGSIALGTAGAAGTIATGTGTTTIAAPLVAAAGMAKTGAGTLILAGSQPLGGTTSVAAGTLQIDGWTGVDASLVVLADARLTGSGTIGGSATVAGTHAPGTSPGLQTVGGDLGYQPGATVEWELWADTESGAGQFFDRVAVGGNLAFSGTTTLELIFTGSASTVDWTDPFWGVNRTWTMFDVAGSTSGSSWLGIGGGDWLDAAAQTLSSARPGGTFALALAEGGAGIQLHYLAAVPEPSAVVLAALGLAALGLVTRMGPVRAGKLGSPWPSLSRPTAVPGPPCRPRGGRWRPAAGTPSTSCS